jgi:hypothetical protein
MITLVHGLSRSCIRHSTFVVRHLRVVRHFLLALLLASCIDESANTVAFDQLLESATFENQLLTRVIIYRDDVPIDTLNARERGVYPIGRKGAVRHAWRILPPIDNSGDFAGESPYENLGVQYRVRAEYVIDSDALSDGTLFTPNVVNLTPYSLRITANYLTSEQSTTNYTVPANSVSSKTHAPYFYWISNSNIRLTQNLTGRVFEISRNDSTSLGTLRLDRSSAYSGAGLTEPIIVDY